MILKFDLESLEHTHKNAMGNTAKPCWKLDNFFKMAEGESSARNDRKATDLIRSKISNEPSNDEV